MRRFVWLVIVAVIFAGAAHAQSELIAARASAVPTIDGDLSDACWAAAQPLAGFTVATTTKPADKAVTVRALFDEDHLYFADE